MVNPEDGLKSFQIAFANRQIKPNKGDIHTDILCLMDTPNGETRLTYGLLKNNLVIATAVFIPADPIEGSLCFNAGYAVDKKYRQKGYGKEVVQKAIDELVNGFTRAKVPSLYIEALVSVKNEASNRLAKSLFSSDPIECTDSYSGQASLQYIKKLI